MRSWFLMGSILYIKKNNIVNLRMSNKSTHTHTKKLIILLSFIINQHSFYIYIFPSPYGTSSVLQSVTPFLCKLQSSVYCNNMMYVRALKYPTHWANVDQKEKKNDTHSHFRHMLIDLFKKSLLRAILSIDRSFRNYKQSCQRIIYWSKKMNANVSRIEVR